PAWEVSGWGASIASKPTRMVESLLALIAVPPPGRWPRIPGERSAVRVRHHNAGGPGLGYGRARGRPESARDRLRDHDGHEYRGHDQDHDHHDLERPCSHLPLPSKRSDSGLGNNRGWSWLVPSPPEPCRDHFPPPIGFGGPPLVESMRGCAWCSPRAQEGPTVEHVEAIGCLSQRSRPERLQAMADAWTRDQLTRIPAQAPADRKSV